MTVRAKVVCSNKRKFNNEDGESLDFYPVYTGSEENKEFFKYTPGGTINLNVTKQAVADQFTIGKEYYLDFSPAE